MEAGTSNMQLPMVFLILFEVLVLFFLFLEKQVNFCGACKQLGATS